MKNHLIVTGGAGFVGSNLINLLLSKTNYTIISLDNYSSGSKKNHINNKRVQYIKCDTINIEKVLKSKIITIKAIFTLQNFQGFTKVLKNLTSVSSQIL